MPSEEPSPGSTFGPFPTWKAYQGKDSEIHVVEVKNTGNATNGLDVRIAGQDFTPQQIKAMDDAWNAKPDGEKRDALSSGKMNDPKAAMDYLGVE